MDLNQMHEVFGNLPDPACACGCDGNVLYRNDAAAAFRNEGVGVLLTEFEQRHVDRSANRTYTIERGAIAGEIVNSLAADPLDRTE